MTVYEVNAPAPHRGVLILVLGILSLGFCALTGPFAWLMIREDMAAIRAGRMGKSGEQMTQIGKIMGIIGTLIMLLMIAGYISIAVIASAESYRGY